MNPKTTPLLREASELLNTGQLQKASIVLAKTIKAEPQNAYAWYLLSLALTEPEKKIFALERALQINPRFIHAQTKLAKLKEIEITPPSVDTEVASDITASSKTIESAYPQTSDQGIPRALSNLSPSVRETFIEWLKPKEHFIPDEGFRTDISHKPSQRIKIRLNLARHRFLMSWRIFSQSRLAILGLAIIFLFGIMAVAHPILMKTVWTRNVYDPVTGFDGMVFPHPTPPGPGHLLGTDTLGRDVFSMILAATTPTFVVGFTAALTTAFIGTLLSVTAAYFRGAMDSVITNLADVFLLFPAPIIMVIIGARFRDLGPMALGLIYGFVTGAGSTTIVMRALAIQVINKPFMEAANIAGGGPSHIINKHLIPSVLPLAALQMMIAVSGAVVADGFISFFGITRTTMNWGTIIYDAFVYGSSIGGSDQMWHMLIPAAGCFSLFALGFYLVSRGLHRVASPTLRERY
jgi:peptide/nickel transport system permease protein